MSPKKVSHPQPEVEPILNSQQFAIDHGGEDDHDGGDHVDEKWLVSYADLMTLLFGLFVMLYVLAMETQGDPNKVLKQNQAESASLKSPAELEQIQQELVSLRSQNSQFLDAQAQLESKQNEIDNLKQELSEKLAERLPASQTDSTKEQKERELIKKIEELSQASKEKNQKIDSLEAKLEDLNSKQPQAYFMIMSKWSTEKHDVDMRVTDPKGKVFRFNARKHKDNPGNFEIDSRIGPGLELWKAISPLPGEYKVDLTLYNNYGNEVKTNLDLQLITPFEVLDKTNIELELQGQKTQSFWFVLDEKSRVKELNKKPLGSRADASQ